MWVSYFESGSTLPPPFNILPTVECAMSLLTKIKGKGRKPSDKYKVQVLGVLDKLSTYINITS